jgi:hypothetical protein
MSITGSKKVITPQESKELSAMKATITSQLDNVRTDSTSELNKLKAELDRSKAELAQKKEALEKVLTLEAARKVQSEHDKAEALKQKVAEQDNSGVSIIRNGLTQADLVEVQLLAIVNNKRVSKGLLPFNSYSEYLAVYDNPATLGQKINPPAEKVDPVAPLDKLIEQRYDADEGRPVKAQGEVYLIATQGYYIGWNRSRAYIQKVESDEVNILVAGDRLYGDSSVMTIIPNKSFRDLTKAEVDNIVKAKPAYKDLFKAYSKFQNYQNVYLDTQKSVAVW